MNPPTSFVAANDSDVAIHCRHAFHRFRAVAESKQHCRGLATKAWQRAAANVVYLEYPAMVLRRWFCASDSMALNGMIFGG
jgi:hypothetical protein